MTPQELDSFLRKCSEAETVFRSTRQPQNTGVGEMKQEEFFHPWSTIEVVRNERFHAVPAHSHDYIEMNYVWSGRCTQYVEGRAVETQQGDICIMDTDAVHALGVCKENDIVVNLLMKKEYFDSSFLSRMTRAEFCPHF